MKQCVQHLGAPVFAWWFGEVDGIGPAMTPIKLGVTSTAALAQATILAYAGSTGSTCYMLTNGGATIMQITGSAFGSESRDLGGIAGGCSTAIHCYVFVWGLDRAIGSDDDRCNRSGAYWTFYNFQKQGGEMNGDGKKPIGGALPDLLPGGLDLSNKKFVIAVESDAGIAILASPLIDQWEIVRYAQTILGVTVEDLRKKHQTKSVIIPVAPGNPFMRKH